MEGTLIATRLGRRGIKTIRQNIMPVRVSTFSENNEFSLTAYEEVLPRSTQKPPRTGPCADARSQHITHLEYCINAIFLSIYTIRYFNYIIICLTIVRRQII